MPHQYRFHLQQQQQLQQLQMTLKTDQVKIFLLSEWKTCLVKYGTLTCADGFIRLDIYSKDVMLAVCFAIFILQGNNIFVWLKVSLTFVKAIGGAFMGFVNCYRRFQGQTQPTNNVQLNQRK